MEPDGDYCDEDSSESPLPDRPDVELDWDGDEYENWTPKFGFITLDGIGRQRVRVDANGKVFISELKRLGAPGWWPPRVRGKAAQERHVAKLKLRRERQNKSKQNP